MTNDVNLEKINFTVVNNEGLEVICDTLSSYFDEENDKLYVVFTDYTLDTNNKFNLYVKEAIKSDTEYELKEVEDKQLKLRLINETFNKIL